MTPPESVTITVHPPGAEADALTVSDAMQQVLDAFELLSKAEEAIDPKERIVWRLERASTNSPLTIEAIAVGSDPEADVRLEAMQAKATLAGGLKQILFARSKPAWIDESTERTVRRILQRTLNGIGRTDLHLSEDAPILIDHQSASKAIGFLDIVAAEAAAKVEDLTRVEFGSVEGSVAGTATHYGKPAIWIRARLSGLKVKCVFSPSAVARIGPQRNWEEAWTNQRVLVTGRLHYNKEGQLTFVSASDVVPIPSTDVRLNQLQDPNRSGDTDSEKYLRTIWGDTDG